jgi:hypothetical protein
MVKQLKKRFIFLALMGIILSITLHCRFYDIQTEKAGNPEIRYYSFNPETILESLSEGNTDVFNLITATPEVRSSGPTKPVFLSQADYVRIAQALHEQIWGVSVEDQNLQNMSFEMDCIDVARGIFKSADFDFYQIIQAEGEETRIEYTIMIRPSEGLIYTSKREFRPNMQIMKPVDLGRYNVTAEEALGIAEKYGGSEKRLEVGNTCNLDVIAPGPDYKGWRILYVDAYDNLKPLLEIAVDPQTGEDKVIYPKPE